MAHISGWTDSRIKLLDTETEKDVAIQMFFQFLYFLLHIYRSGKCQIFSEKEPCIILYRFKLACPYAKCEQFKLTGSCLSMSVFSHSISSNGDAA